MVFGWQGFTVEHPDDWAPVALTGNRAEGYARIESPRHLSLHLRWRRAKRSEHLVHVERYLDRLAADSAKAKRPFKRESTEEADGRIFYRYSGVQFARGVLLPDQKCGRVFFIELMSDRNESVSSQFNAALNSFSSDMPSSERWSLHGLDVSLPAGLAVERREFLAGKTLLALAGSQARLIAQRWGLAEQLLARHSLEDWARASLGMKSAVVEDAESGILLRQRRPLSPDDVALVRPQFEMNQITVVRGASRNPAWRPQWDWLN